MLLLKKKDILKRKKPFCPHQMQTLTNKGLAQKYFWHQNA